MDDLSENYVKLVLKIGQYDNDFVDAYYGPVEWKSDSAKADKLPLEDFMQRVSQLQEEA